MYRRLGTGSVHHKPFCIAYRENELVRWLFVLARPSTLSYNDREPTQIWTGSCAAVSHATHFLVQLNKLRSQASLPNSPASVLTAFSSFSKRVQGALGEKRGS